MEAMFAAGISDVTRARSARFLLVLLLLAGLAFMHGACAAAGVTSRGEGTRIAASQVTEPAPTRGTPYRGGHDEHHAPCCHLVADHDCAVLVVALLLLLILGGRAVRVSVSAGLRRTAPRRRTGPPGGVSRLTLCVIRI